MSLEDYTEITPVEKLPNFNGRPVPWITRWTGEVMPDRYEYGLQVTGDPHAGEFRLTYSDGKNMRDNRGILWQREGIGRKGEPMWADVSTYRQRAAMKRGLCQVCGHKIDGRPYRFLIPRDGMEEFETDTWVTMQAPVCVPCVPLALKLCPALKRDGYQLLKVTDYELWGIFGQVTFLTDDGFRKMQTAVAFDTTDYGDTFRLDHVLAQQLVIKLGNFVIEESHIGNRQPKKVGAMGDFLHRLEQRRSEEAVNEYAERLKAGDPEALASAMRMIDKAEAAAVEGD